MDYKDTLLMPKTKFEMRGGLVTKEPISQTKWIEEDIYNERLKLNKGNEQFVLHDGPPYANGKLHVGHALNKVLKDFVIRSYSMQGYYSPYIPGWDTHGLPIETAITKTGVKRKEMSVLEFRKLCEQYALKQVDIQKEAFKTYNILGDWDNPYVTLEKQYEARQIEVFAKMVERGLIFKGLRPVNWSPSSESALAEAEIEYYEREDTAIYVKFDVVDGLGVVDNDVSFLTWTTMPWTLLGVVAVAVSENDAYGLYSSAKGNFIVAQALVEKVFEKFDCEFTLVKTFKGSEFEHVVVQNPVLNERKCPVVLGDHVTTTDGTGCVTTAPGHGDDDFNCGKKYDLDIIVLCNDRGVLTDEASSKYAGQFWEVANQNVVVEAQELGNLLFQEKFVHSYPHDWRTKKPIVFRATAQWFASIELIREDILNEISNEIKWYPAWGKTRLYNMIKDRGDWCISRQRAWGVPIPIVYDENNEGILDSSLMNHFAKLFEVHGSDIWFEWDVEKLLPTGFTHPGSPNGLFTKETDIMDVWFDSGSSHYAVSHEYGINYPYQLYLEGSDQYRGWFNSSLITGVAINNCSPYERIVSHGMVLDGKGFAMSKSLGNTIDPADLLKQFGADILRLWVASVDYQQDTKMSIDVMKQTSESYKKIRNTCRFLSGNLNSFDSVNNLVKYEDMDRIDQYMMHKLNALISNITTAYNEFEFQTVYKEVMKFITDLSGFYFEYAKDSLYADDITSAHRLSIQTYLYHTMFTLMTFLTPILPHTMDDLYRETNIGHDKKKSVYLENFTKEFTLPNDDFKDIELFFEVRKDLLKSLEMLRGEKVIGKSLEAKVYLNVTKEEEDILTSIGNLRELFVTSDVVFTEEELTLVENYRIKTEKMDGDVCPRCWNVFESIDDVCERCDNVLNSL